MKELFFFDRKIVFIAFDNIKRSSLNNQCVENR